MIKSSDKPVQELLVFGQIVGANDQLRLSVEIFLLVLTGHPSQRFVEVVTLPDVLKDDSIL